MGLTIPNMPPRKTKTRKSKNKNKEGRPNLGRFIDPTVPKMGKRISPSSTGVTRAMVEKVFLKRYGKDDLMEHISTSWTTTELKNAIVLSYFKD